VALTGALHGHSASGDPLNEVRAELQKLMGAGFPEFPRASGIGDHRLNMPRKVERRSGPVGPG